MKSLFSVYDSRAQLYGPIIVDVSPVNVARSFTEACRGEDSMLHRYPEDYELQCLGTFNEETGEIVSHPGVCVLSAQEVKRRIQVREVTDG